MWQITALETSRPNSSPGCDPNAAPRAQQGPAEIVIYYLAKQGRSGLALHKFPSATSLGLTGPIPWEYPCWVLEDHVLPVVQEKSCVQRWGYCSEAACASSLCDLAKGQPHGFQFQLMSHHLAHAVPFAMQAGCLARLICKRVGAGNSVLSNPN